MWAGVVIGASGANVGDCQVRTWGADRRLGQVALGQGTTVRRGSWDLWGPTVAGFVEGERAGGAEGGWPGVDRNGMWVLWSTI